MTKCDLMIALALIQLYALTEFEFILNLFSKLKLLRQYSHQLYIKGNRQGCPLLLKVTKDKLCSAFKDSTVPLSNTTG